MDSLLIAGDHLLVVVVDVLRGGAGAPAGGHHVPAVLSGGPHGTSNMKYFQGAGVELPGKPVTRVSSAAHHQVRIARVAPAVPQLTVPAHTPRPVQSLLEVALHHPVGLQVHHIVVARGDGLQSVGGRVERPAGHGSLITDL